GDAPRGGGVVRQIWIVLDCVTAQVRSQIGTRRLGEGRNVGQNGHRRDVHDVWQVTTGRDGGPLRGVVGLRNSDNFQGAPESAVELLPGAVSIDRRRRARGRQDQASKLTAF